MSPQISLPGLNPLNTAANDPAKIKDAAQQFEAMLIEQMMKSAHEDGGEWTGGDQAGSTMSELAQQQFARVLADNGGMGLAKLVTRGLEQK